MLDSEGGLTIPGEITSYLTGTPTGRSMSFRRFDHVETPVPLRRGPGMGKVLMHGYEEITRSFPVEEP